MMTCLMLIGFLFHIGWRKETNRILGWAETDAVPRRSSTYGTRDGWKRSRRTCSL